jgi:ubiquitin-like 1-activating enzyme E1 B
MNPLAGLEKTVGPDLLQKIQGSNLLLVGSGGIGCELLKNLALSGFRSVQVIDLDTIDVSNLNRQLLFRNQHVGMPKCTVACQVAAAMVPDSDGVSSSSSLAPVSYVAHHGNICHTDKFNVEFMKPFDLVLNALDNVEARRRVNRLCLASNTPLIEAGTTGYLGQVTVIHKPSNIACYECVTQETQKVYPICTIRSTPSMPVHTIVWAKECYKLLFHPKMEESMLYEDPQGEEPSTYMEHVIRLRELLLLQASQNNTEEDNNDNVSDNNNEAIKTVIQQLLIALYTTEISKQLEMGRYKAAKKTPTPLSVDFIEKGIHGVNSIAVTSTQAIWQPTHCISESVQCVLEAATSGSFVLPEFDKDDAMAMRFVTANSNLRSFVFGIEPLQSIYSAKGIAGNIIPAIATTNAICAGLQILQVFSILKTMLQHEKQETTTGTSTPLQLQDACQYVNCVRQKTRNGLFLTAIKLEAPNPKCFVCRNATIPLTLNVHQWTLQQFLEKICKSRLGFEQPTIMLQGDLIWEEGDGADTAAYQPNLIKLLPNLPCGGIPAKTTTVLELEDFTQDLTVQVSVTHREEWDEEDGDHPFLVGGEVPKAAAATASAPTEAAAAAAPANGEDEEDVCLVVDDDDDKQDAKQPAAKRDPPTTSTEDAAHAHAAPPAKKQKTNEENGGVPVTATVAAAADDDQVIEID